MDHINCVNTIDCKQGAVRAVRFNGKLNQMVKVVMWARMQSL